MKFPIADFIFDPFVLIFVYVYLFGMIFGASRLKASHLEELGR